MQEHHSPKHYQHLTVMALLSFIAMYMLMYSMVNALSNVFNNVNQVYMAGVMASPMVIIELVVMRQMYADARLNTLIAAAAVIVGVALFVLLRQQSGVGDRQFLRSMIPHHASAILMCNEASIRDAEIRRLCGEIVSSQQREIDQMKTILRRLGESRQASRHVVPYRQVADDSH